MIWAGITLGGCAFVLAHRFREAIDARAEAFLAYARALLSPTPAADEDLSLCGRLISSLQAGISLDAALEAAAAEAPSGSPLRRRLRTILSGARSADFLGSFLSSALETGMPVLASLQNLERALRARRKLALKATALSSQCRAQAEVLSWLPWVLAGAIAFTDFEWFFAAAHNALSWFLWAIAVLLNGLGRRWIAGSLKRVLRPQGAAERLEEEALPDFTLRIIAAVSQGIDVESATERALAACANRTLSEAFSGAAAGKLLRLRSTLHHASRTGAPVREELSNFLQDLSAELESRWEERVQRLPVALLGPLFVCFFPGSLLVLIGLLLPLFRMSL
ncbi:MAG: hypothetical protein ACXWR4_19195 [Bdellovibrionota bacterium]